MIEIKSEEQISAEKIFTSMTEDEKLLVGKLIALQYPVAMLEAVTEEMRMDRNKLDSILDVLARRA